MLIKLNELITNHNISPTGVIHIGAHDAQEYEAYTNAGIKKMIWVEANPLIASRLQEKFLKDKNIKVVNALITDINGELLTFHITNNEQSSSVLELGTHRQLFPGVKVLHDITLTSKTLDSVMLEEAPGFRPNFMNIDVQGAELLVLQGAKNTLPMIDAIYTEINTDYVYKDCALVGEIDEYLSGFGFYRAQTEMYMDHPWGDALYLRKNK
jgi:FkbM family methyltransferase